MLQALAKKFGHDFTFTEHLIGGAAIDATGSALEDSTIEGCASSDGILLGAVGGPKWDGQAVRPEQGLLKIRKALDLFANLRPISGFPELLDASPLKPEIISGVDFMVVRELTGGIYFGERQETDANGVAWDTMHYSKPEVERIVRLAATIARGRDSRLLQVDKANVLASSRLWRTATTELMAKEFPDVELKHGLVDSVAMDLITKPKSFDVIVTENMFGDILTDEASVLSGSLGLLPSASLSSEGRPGLYEPIHGSAPDIAGQAKVAQSPATIRSHFCFLFPRPTLWDPSSARPCCCATALAWRRRPSSWRTLSVVFWPMVCARQT